MPEFFADSKKNLHNGVRYSFLGVKAIQPGKLFWKTGPQPRERLVYPILYSLSEHIASRARRYENLTISFILSVYSALMKQTNSQTLNLYSRVV